MKTIILTRGYSTIVDDIDYKALNKHKWWANITHNNHVYAERTTWDGIRQRNIKMHRQLMGFPVKLLVDHINGDSLDNRKENLRLATNAENLRNSKLSRANKTGFKGVSLDKRRNKFRAYIVLNKRQLWLGYFGCAKQASIAYNRAAIKYFGKFARV